MEPPTDILLSLDPHDLRPIIHSIETVWYSQDTGIFPWDFGLGCRALLAEHARPSQSSQNRLIGTLIHNRFASC